MNFFQKLKLRKDLKKHINRPLDINEILSRDTATNVVVDAYEFFMRRCNWQIDDSFNDTIKTFLLCVLYEGEIYNGGISQFLLNSSGDYAHQIADALHTIGAFNSEKLLRKSFSLFKDGIVPASEEIRYQMIEEMTDVDSVFEQLDIEVYNEDIDSFCYKFLLENKDMFVE